MKSTACETNKLTSLEVLQRSRAFHPDTDPILIRDHSESPKQCAMSEPSVEPTIEANEPSVKVTIQSKNMEENGPANSVTNESQKKAVPAPREVSIQSLEILPFSMGKQELSLESIESPFVQ